MSPDKTYSGICIGGPRAGQRIETMSPYYETYEEPISCSATFPPDPNGVEELKRFSYAHVTGVRSGNGSICDFFVPADKAHDQEWPILQIISYYERQNK